MPVIANLYYFASPANDQNKKRPPVILLHGAGGDHLTWPPQIRRLDVGNIYSLDLPGHGKSEGAGRQSIDEYAGDVIAFMKALNIRAAVMVGISMGSAIALQLALKHPGKVLSLGLLGTGAKLRVAPVLLETVGNENSFESAVTMLNDNCFSIHAQRNLVRLSKRRMMEMRPSVLLGDFLACNQFDATSQLEKINAPTLIICGSEDRMMPVKFSESLRDGIAGSQLHILDAAGHMVMLEQPDAVAGLLKQFIENIPNRIRKTSRKKISHGGKISAI